MNAYVRYLLTLLFVMTAAGTITWRGTSGGTSSEPSAPGRDGDFGKVERVFYPLQRRWNFAPRVSSVSIAS